MDVIDARAYSSPFTSFSKFCPAKEDIWFDFRDEEVLFRGTKRYRKNRDLYTLFLFFIAMNRSYRLEKRDIFDIKRVQTLGTLC